MGKQRDGSREPSPCFHITLLAFLLYIQYNNTNDIYKGAVALENTKLTPIRFPVDLLSDLDKLVGPGKRSKFIIEATQKELLRLKQKKALSSAAGIFKEMDYPEFATNGDTYSWVRKLREETEARRREIFER